MILLLRFYLWLCRITMSVRIESVERFDSQSQHPKVFTFWHDTSLFLPMLWSAASTQEDAIILSRSKDAQRVAPIVRLFGIQPIAGSSSKSGKDKGGLSALIGARNHLRKGGSVWLALDGPAGPPRVPKPGLERLQAATDAETYFISLEVQRPWRANSWDQMYIPYPFCKAVLKIELSMSLVDLKPGKLDHCGSEAA